ncbi:hypothetical protein CMI45_01440 [Candidatus Pacearchaeota archaeon]|nr:hypothetical protein [Candidatus Pacearchaeota archaeon]|tara:strand:+ start:8946 stop:9809 length:864 start_codon:yes stop_codon:yes gene_type:complete
MKRVILAVLLGVFMISLVSAASCSLDAKLINQDPYPVIPGDEVKVVFQLNGISNPECKNVVFELVEEFPFELIPGQEARVTAEGGTVSDFNTYLLIPYKLRVAKDARDGDNSLEIKFSNGVENNKAITVREFNITVEDLETDFEVSIKDYVAGTRTLTFEILNIGENDVEALTVEIPKQESISIKGSNRNIVGSLDSNEDTTFSFEAVPTDGEIDLVILYTDEISERRQLEKSVTYDSSYFTGRARDQNGGSKTTYYIIAFVVLVIIFWLWRRKKKKDKQKNKHRHE